MGRANPRMFALDVLRGVAVSLVLVRHIPAKPLPGEHVTNALFEMGWTGVDLFFVLSGFLISGLLLGEASRTGEIRFQRFWLRRGMKIWPSYYAVYGALALAKIAADVVRHQPLALASGAPNLVFIQNYFPADIRWAHSWSLAIEEHFYLVLPLGMGVLVRRGALRVLPILCAGLCVTILAARCILGQRADWHWADFYYPTQFRADSLLFGVIIGYAYHHHFDVLKQIARAWPALLAMVGVALAMAVVFPLEDDARLSYTAGFTVLYLAFGGAVIVAAVYPGAGAGNPIARAVAWMGVYSYTIYLCHSVVMRFPGADRLPMLLRRHVIDSPWVDRLVFWTASIAAGYVASHLIERPFLALRERWLPGKRDLAAER